MAITTGAELATAAASWLARADLTARIPEFVALAEAKFNRELRTPDMETKNATFSITGEYVAVPADFLEVRRFYLNNSTKDVLTYMDPDTMTEYFGAASGTPKYFAVVGSNFQFGPVPDATYSSTLVYYTSLTTVSTGGSAVNWLLTSHPDLYLYGTLLEGAGYLHDPQTAMQWAAMYKTALDSVKSKGQRQRWGGNGMAVRAA